MFPPMFLKAIFKYQMDTETALAWGGFSILWKGVGVLNGRYKRQSANNQFCFEFTTLTSSDLFITAMLLYFQLLTKTSLCIEPIMSPNPLMDVCLISFFPFFDISKVCFEFAWQLNGNMAADALPLAVATAQCSRNKEPQKIKTFCLCYGEVFCERLSPPAPRCSLMSHCHQALWGGEAPAAWAS